MAHMYTYPEIHATILEANDEDAWPKRLTLDLGPRDAAWNPASTKGVINGPIRAAYELHADGGWSISFPDPLPTHSALMRPVFEGTKPGFQR